MLDAVQELLNNLDLVLYFDTPSLMQDPDATFAKFVQKLSELSSKRYNLHYCPCSAIQPEGLTHYCGLNKCGPQPITAALFPHCPMLSPLAVFQTKQTVIVNTAGTLSAMCLDIGFTSGFSMLIAGSKLFFMFGVTNANL